MSNPVPEGLTRHRYDVVADGAAGKVEIAVIVNGKVETRLPAPEVGLLAIIPRGGATYTIEKVKIDATGTKLANWQKAAISDIDLNDV